MRFFAAVAVPGLAFLVTLATPVPGHAGERDLRVLASTLEDELRNADLDDDTRAEVTAHLARSLELVRRSGGRRVRSSACLDFAVPIYERVYQASAALEYGMKFCAEPIDTEVLSSAFAVYRTVYDPQAALKSAGELARRDDLSGKSQLLAFAFDRYRKVYDGTAALKNAADLVARTPRDAGHCIERAYATYAKQWDGTAALKKSFEVCR